MRAIVSLIVVAMLLGGCTAIRTVYNQAEHLAAWRADDYFDLTNAQKQQFRSAFTRLHAWHRATQLEPYADLLAAVEGRLARGPEMQDVAWALDRVRTHARHLVQRAYPEAAALLGTLSDAQVEAARHRFERENRKFAREHAVDATAEEQKRVRAKRDLELIEHWAGTLERDQRKQFAALSEAQPLVAGLRHQDRMRRQAEFLALLEQRRDPRFPERLRDWLLDWNASRPVEMDQRIENYYRARNRMLLRVFEQLRPEQQRQVKERLQAYVGAMRDLSRDVRREADTNRPHSAATP